MSESKRVILSFSQKIQLRDWMIANHEYICKQQMTRNTCADEATKTLGFPVNTGHLPDIIKATPDLRWPFTAMTGDKAINQQEIDALREQMQLMDIGITDINTKIAQIQSQYESISKEVSSLRDNINEKLASLERSANVTTSQINSIRETIKGMNQSLNMAMDQLGFEKINSVIGAVAAVAKKRY